MVVSPYIIAFAVGWAMAQCGKYVVAAIKMRTLKVFDHLYISGNMPSAHSATMMSLVSIIGLKDGVGSGLVGLALALAAIVMYDALMVRRSVGEQGEAIKQVIDISKFDVSKPRSAKGHTPLEVVVGAVIGLLAGIVVFLATKN